MLPLRIYCAVIMLSVVSSCDIEQKVIHNSKKAFEYYSEGDKLKAAKKFEKLTTKYPGSNFYGKNIFNTAYIYMEIDSLEKSEKYFNKILSLELNDNEKDSSRSIWITRANYKHYAARNIGKIHIQKGSWKTAMYYLKMSRYRHQYLSDSIVSIKRQELSVDKMMAKCYLNLNRPDSALLLMLSHALVESPWSRHPAKEMALEIIENYYDPKKMFDELIIAFNNIKRESNFVILPFLDKKLVIIPYKTIALQLDKDYFKSTALYVDLYQMTH